MNRSKLIPSTLTPTPSPAGQWKLLSLLFLCLVFLFHSYPLGLSDFWWHMNNGRWIWDTLSLPSTDPFTYSYARDDDIRRVVILKAYYLGQVSFYFVHSLLGIWGLLFYKTLLLLVPYILLLKYLRYRDVDPVFAILLLCPLPFIIFRLDELRPHIFSFIGAVWVFYLLERFIDALKAGQRPHQYAVLIPIVMLAWANLHRGFIIGWVILFTYLFFAIIHSIRGKNSLTPQQLKLLIIVCSTGILITLLNPNGANAFLANFVELKGPFMQVIDEFFPLWKYSKLYQAWHIFFGCVAITLLTAYFFWQAFIRGTSRPQAVHLVLAAGFAYEGFATFRFSHFLCFLLLAIGAKYYAQTSHELVQKHRKVFVSLLLVSLFVLGSFAILRSAVWKGPLETAYIPQKAVEFIQKNRPAENLFNAFEYGGYASWALSPQYKIFIDQRNLDYSVYKEYGRAWNGDYADVFNKYQVNTVLFYLQQPVLGRVPRLVKRLLIDNNWQVVYVDRLSIVLIKAQSNTDLPIYDKNKVANYLIQLDSASNK
ncbi:MAG: hypothetical protein OEZ68_09210 [Gammaproteobacteria bacterium]|nr:hypothetical protein [Gammaproteobacteria bacterium]MDH5800966.1 hypothetical protein [Gammaproteobacteria bacterium]